MNSSMMILLRVIHIGCGVLWVGSAVFLALFLMPTVRAIGPAGGLVIKEIAGVRKVPIYIMIFAILTVLSGLILYWRDSAGAPGFARSGMGMTLGMGGALALVTLVVGMGINAPTGKRMTELAAQIAASGRPPTPEQAAQMQRLQNKLASAGNFVAALLVLTTIAMAAARYVG